MADLVLPPPPTILLPQSLSGTFIPKLPSQYSPFIPASSPSVLPPERGLDCQQPHRSAPPRANPSAYQLKDRPNKLGRGRGREGTHLPVPTQQPGERCRFVATRGRAPPPRAEATTAVAMDPAGLTEDEGVRHSWQDYPEMQPRPGLGLRLRKTRASDAAPRPPPWPRPELPSLADSSCAPSWPQ